MAKFAANNIPKKLLADPAFSKGNFEVALVNSCAETDCMLLSEEGRLECGGYRGDVGREAVSLGLAQHIV